MAYSLYDIYKNQNRVSEGHQHTIRGGRGIEAESNLSLDYTALKTPIGNINTGVKSEYSGSYPSGSASGELLFASDYCNLWDSISCNNPFKWRPVEGTQGVFDWDAADYVYNYAQNNNKPFYWHTLLWGASQGYPSWFSGLSETDSKAALDAWFSAIAVRYTNVAGFQTLNEIYPGHQSDTETILKPQLGGAGSTGFDWVIYVFERARYYFPNAKLWLNDYGLLSSATKRQYIIDVALILKARGLIDALGCQAHYFNINDMTSSEITTALDDIYTQLDLPVYITEFDISGDDSTQLSRYREVFPALYNHKSVKRITIWGYIVGETWRYSSGFNTGLINRDGTGERPALTWLKSNYLEN